MSQYQLYGQIIGRDSRGFLTSLDRGALTVNLPDGIDTFNYRTVDTPSESLPEIEITSRVLGASLQSGRLVLEDDLLAPDSIYTTHLGRVDWGGMIAVRSFFRSDTNPVSARQKRPSSLSLAISFLTSTL